MGQVGSILDQLEPVPVNITSSKLYVHGQDVKVVNPKYLKFPFIDDKDTVEYVFGSRVIFITRGLPGSGKSTLARAIKGTYPDSVLCSSDDFFIRNYRFEYNRDNLHDAQVSCQQKARHACEDGVNVVVVDNANVRKWELDYFLELAVENCYVVVVMEPRTPWKWDPEQLAKKNTHKVKVEVMFAKMEMWDTTVPLYFGWFLNMADSRILSLVGQAHLEECLTKAPEFAEDFKNFSHASELEDMLKYYALPATCPKGMLHCTSKFCLGGKVPGSLEYSQSEEVTSNCGRSYQLCIIGFLITPRTFGARVKLDEDMLTLWANDQDSPYKPASSGSSLERRPAPFDLTNPGSSSSQDEQPPVQKPITKKLRDHRPPCRASLVTFKKFESSFHPTSGSGSQAHVTLGCAEGVSAVTTGFDLKEIIACEEDPEKVDKVEMYTLDRGYLRNYGESRWMLYLHQQIVVNTLFSGHYGSS